MSFKLFFIFADEHDYLDYYVIPAEDVVYAKQVVEALAISLTDIAASDGETLYFWTSEEKGYLWAFDEDEGRCETVEELVPIAYKYILGIE